MGFFEFLSSLLAGIFGSPHPSANVSPEVSTVDTKASAPPGWEGEPPYRYIDVSRYQGKITLDGWRKVKTAGYKGVVLKTVSTNRKLSKRADGLYIDPTFETNYRNAKAAGLDVGVLGTMVRNAGQLPQPFWLGAAHGGGSHSLSASVARA